MKPIVVGGHTGEGAGTGAGVGAGAGAGAGARSTSRSDIGSSGTGDGVDGVSLDTGQLLEEDLCLSPVSRPVWCVVGGGHENLLACFRNGEVGTYQSMRGTGGYVASVDRFVNPPVAASACGWLVAVAVAKPAGRNVELWDRFTLRCYTKLKASDHTVRALCLLGHQLAVGDEKGKIRVWDIALPAGTVPASKRRVRKPKLRQLLRGHCGFVGAALQCWSRCAVLTCAGLL